MLVPNAVLARVFLGQRMGAQLLLGSAVAMAGIALLFLHEVRLNPRGPGEAVLGIGLTALAILSASTSNVLQATDTAKRYPMVPTLAVAMLLGAALDGAIALVLSGPPVIEWRPAYIGGIVYLGLIGSPLTFPLYFGVVRAIGPAKAAYSGVIVPVIAMLLSTLFEGYRWTGLAVAGAALAGAGLAGAVSRVARRPAEHALGLAVHHAAVLGIESARHRRQAVERDERRRVAPEQPRREVDHVILRAGQVIGEVVRPRRRIERGM
eukprot:gene12820-17081_t